MDIKKFDGEFIIIFLAALVIAAVVTLIWNAVIHPKSEVDLGISFLFATLFGTFQAWEKFREIKGNKGFKLLRI